MTKLFGDYTNIYFDAEYTGPHQNTSLISIGLVSDSGAYFYAEFSDYKKEQVTDWIWDNVICNLVMPNSNAAKKYGKNYLWDVIDPQDGAKYVTTLDFQSHQDIVMRDTTENIRDALIEWLRLESQYNTARYKPVQICGGDCYGYAWPLFVDLVCNSRGATKLPRYIRYIPMDLCTYFSSLGYDPDTLRERFAAMDRNAMAGYPFTEQGDNSMSILKKPNSLYDAYIVKACYTILNKYFK